MHPLRKSLAKGSLIDGAAEGRLRHISFYEIECADAERELQLARARQRAAELKSPKAYRAPR